MASGEPPQAAPAPMASGEPPQAAPAPMPPPVAAAPPPPVGEVPAPTAQFKPEAQPAPPEPKPGGEQAAAPAPVRAPDAPVAVELRRQGENLKLSFPFAAPTPAAVFRRADTLWLVFDSKATIDLAALAGASRMFRGVTATPMQDGQVVRITLDRPLLAALAPDGAAWTVTIGDVALDPTRPLGVIRNTGGGGRATATIPFDNPHKVYRLTDPAAGDTLFVVTALAPARGFLKAQDFVEFNALASTHGVVIQPLADDVTVELASDRVVVGRPGGLTLSSAAAPAPKRAAGYNPLAFDAQVWGFDQQANFRDRQAQLLAVAAGVSEQKRAAARLELARFYLARGMYPEAKGVLDVTLDDEHPTAADAAGLVLRGVTDLMLSRPEEALHDLTNPRLGNQHDAQLWRAVAYTQQGKWAEAREAFRGLNNMIGGLPLELQRLVLLNAVRSSIGAHDYASGADELNELEQIGVADDLKPTVAVLNGELAEALGRNSDALEDFRSAGESKIRPVAAEGRLREMMLRYQLGDLKRSDAINDLETLTTVWRGDNTEAEALRMLARLYTEEGRYRDAFHVMRTALQSHPNSEMTRRIQEEAGKTFDSLFLTGKGDSMPAIDALALFYDFKELVPVGRRGDEMIRRLSDRLVSVDLLDQAAELLQHQVDHRLQGAARAQVATRLAVIYLMNRKPDRALATLRATRLAELPSGLRDQRLLLEARALSDIGRHEVAIEVIANVDGPEAIRLRSDILWAAKRWREAAEQLELLYGDRWRDFRPLNSVERSDILRAAMGYALADDQLGLDRFSGRYAAKMADGADRHAWEVVTAPESANPAEFRDVARAVASADTLDSFLRDMRARYPETGSFAPVDAAARPVVQSRAPSPPAGASVTGSLQRPLRAAAR
jgi:tetratricopeptide (TPR) repeat protein